MECVDHLSIFQVISIIHIRIKTIYLSNINGVSWVKSIKNIYLKTANLCLKLVYWQRNEIYLFTYFFKKSIIFDFNFQIQNWNVDLHKIITMFS